jgi:hypothetical protein
VSCDVAANLLMSTGLAAINSKPQPSGEAAELHRAIGGDGGKVLAIYREPYGGLDAGGLADRTR